MRRGTVRRRRPLQKQVTPDEGNEGGDEGEGKLLMLTLAPNPEYIVKGYDLKELAK